MIGIVVGEVYGSAGGIGMMISQAGSRFQTDRVFVGVLTIVAAGVVLVELLRRVERRVEVWRPRRAGMSVKLEAQDIRLDYPQPRTDTRLVGARRRQSARSWTASSSRSSARPAAARPRSCRWSTA